MGEGGWGWGGELETHLQRLAEQEAEEGELQLRQQRTRVASEAAAGSRVVVRMTQPPHRLQPPTTTSHEQRAHLVIRSTRTGLLSITSCVVRCASLAAARMGGNTTP